MFTVTIDIDVTACSIWQMLSYSFTHLIYEEKILAKLLGMFVTYVYLRSRFRKHGMLSGYHMASMLYKTLHIVRVLEDVLPHKISRNVRERVPVSSSLRSLSF